MVLQNQSLVLDLIEWIGHAPRPYAEVMSAWRTSCPRLTIWEDAADAEFVVRESREGGLPMVRVSPAGRAFLARHRPYPQAAG